MAAPQEPAWRPQWMSPLCSRSAGACMLARPELLQQPHVPIEETGQTRGIAWHQTAVNDRTVLVLVAIVTQIRADDIPSRHASTSHQQSAECESVTHLK